MAARMNFDSEEAEFEQAPNQRRSNRSRVTKLIELVTGTRAISVWPDMSDRQRYAESRATASQCEWEELESHFVAN